MKKNLINILSVVLMLAVFYFLGREFVRNWDLIRSYSFHFDITFLLLASALYVITFFFFSLGFHLILQYLHHPITFLEAVLIFCITQPAKYIPGKIWIAVTRMKFCKPRGVPNTITLLATGTETVLEVMAGAYVSLIAILNIPVLGRFSLLGTVSLTVLGLLLLIPDVFYFFINLFLKIVKRPTFKKDQHASFWKLLLLQLNYIVGLCALGFSQLFFLQSFAPVTADHFPFLVSIGALSYIAGIIALFSPSGLGIREGVWYFALKRMLSPHVALVYAFVSRLWTIVIEAILLFIALPILWILERRKKTTLP